MPSRRKTRPEVGAFSPRPYSVALAGMAEVTSMYWSCVGMPFFLVVFSRHDVVQLQMLAGCMMFVTKIQHFQGCMPIYLEDKPQAGGVEYWKAFTGPVSNDSKAKGRCTVLELEQRRTDRVP